MEVCPVSAEDRVAFFENHARAKSEENRLAAKEVVGLSKPTQGVGVVPMSKDKLTVAAGVDPLLVALATFESGAYDVEVNAGSGMVGAGGGA